MPAKKVQTRCAEAAKASQYTVFKIRLYPDGPQAELMEKTFGCCRYLWNQMLADVQEFYAATDIHYIPTPAKYKKSAPFLAEVDSQALCSVHQNLRKAFLDFFGAPDSFGYPQFKTKKAKKDSFTVYCRPYHTGPSIVLTDNGIRMPKLGLIKARIHRRPAPEWALKRVIITKAATGKYFCSIAFRRETAAPAQLHPAPEKTIGLEYSLRHFYADSNGNCADLPSWVRQSEEKLARMQSRLSRMRRGSKNYAEQSQKIRLLYEHIANQRRDFIHKESRRITNAWDAVCVRDSNLVTLSQQHKGAGRIDSGFGLFRECLKYKLAQQGKPFIVIDRRAPAAKTCHRCGLVQEELTRYSRSASCPQCGALLSHEVNAAINIRNWGLAQLHDLSSETGANSAVS